ncbi:DUF1822 family protein [Spirulina sp. CS-785/01]|uniref:DUF1822 family protein n=1 Tax=Spirulina sp. CS-785/01 TaxID=3021716 RepID=UPI00232BF6A1|nr:DUF1822 family protein [Spirulina sp. CS-785/01]MDB9315419.1 DUF1822 family protein [Spirulina sp. CS-785/01]
MKNSKTLSPLTLPITRNFHQKAQRLAQKQTESRKLRQVYLNTLAVEVVRVYLESLDIPVHQTKSDSLEVIDQTLADVATLVLKDDRRLECRPVLPEAEHCYIPPEVWDNRIGYCAVQFNRDLTEAKLLGFTEKVKQEWIPLAFFSPFEHCLDIVGQTSPMVQLQNWFNQQMEQGWQTLEHLFIPQPSELAMSFRSVSSVATPEATKVQRGKWLNLTQGEEKVALCVGLQPSEEEDMEIWVQVLPQQTQTYLPEKLQLHLLDDQGQRVMQAEARHSEGLEFQFTGNSGERFTVQVHLGDFSVTEHFEI